MFIFSIMNVNVSSFEISKYNCISLIFPLIIPFYLVCHITMFGKNKFLTPQPPKGGAKMKIVVARPSHVSNSHPKFG